MALDTFNPYLFVSAGEQSNKFLTPTYADGIAEFQAQRAQSLTGLTVRIDPIQEGTGDPSPTNIRPISGRTGLTVTRAGKNLLKWESASTTSNGVTFTVNSDGTVTANGTATADASLYATASPYTWLKAGAYVINGCPSGGSNTTYMINETYKSVHDTGNGASFTMSDDGYVRVRIVIRNGYTANNLLFKPMIRPADIFDGTYEPYTAQTYPISWQTEAGTVYGGTLDVVSGVLTVTHAYWTKNTATMDNTEDYPGWRDSGVRAIVGGNSSITYRTLVGSVGSTIGVNTRDNIDIAFLPKNAYNNMTQTQWKALAIDVEFVLPLATPQTYRLTGEDVRTIAGYNQIYSDAGPVIDIKF